jgi:hypothetical protein
MQKSYSLHAEESGNQTGGPFQLLDQTPGKGIGTLLRTIILEETKFTRLCSNLYKLHAICLVIPVSPLLSNAKPFNDVVAKSGY